MDDYWLECEDMQKEENMYKQIFDMTPERMSKKMVDQQDYMKVIQEEEHEEGDTDNNVNSFQGFEKPIQSREKKSVSEIKYSESNGTDIKRMPTIQVKNADSSSVRSEHHLGHSHYTETSIIQNNKLVVNGSIGEIGDRKSNRSVGKINSDKSSGKLNIKGARNNKVHS